jgi:hypothetical protein
MRFHGVDLNYLSRTNLLLLILNLTDLADNFACGSVWVRNLVSDIKGGTQTEGV